MASEYDKGDTVRLTGTFASTAGVPTNPTTVTFWVKAPSSTVAVGVSGSTDVANPATGTFTYDVVPSSTGVWAYRISSTGNIVAAEEAQFVVRTPLIPSTGS